MARYERDYGREYGRWGSRNAGPIGGMRSDAWGGGDWRDFPGEEGWYGEGYEGMPNHGFGSTRQHWQGGRDFDRGFRGGAGMGEFERGYGGGYGGGGQSGFGGGSGWGWQGGGQEFDRGGYGGGRGRYGAEYGARAGYAGYGGRTAETGYGGRDIGYDAGWTDQPRGWGSSRESGFGRSRASEIMTENPEVVTADATISEVARKMRDLDVGIIPVVDNPETRRLRGVITDRDVTVRAIAEGKDGNSKVSDCMTDRVRSVNKNDSIHEVMRVMREEQVRRVPVTDREGRLVGIIAQADLAVDFAGHDSNREMEVGETLERISEPARPQRSGNRMAASGRTQEDEGSGTNTSSSGSSTRSRARSSGGA